MPEKRYKVLIIGGYGTFGARLARLLADESRLQVTIAGRSLHKAKAFCDGIAAEAHFVPAAFDRDGDVVAQLGSIAAQIVVDASGPYQAYGPAPYRVAEAAVAHGAHYLDIADGTDFVCNIGALDSIAREKEVFVLAGASTCPVLSMAAVRRLSRDLREITSITGGIAPSPHAGLGRSVVSAIAGYAGAPVNILRDGETRIAYTLVDTKTYTIAPPGVTPLPAMTFSLLDVPDLRLLRSLDQPVRGVWFGVSTLPVIYHSTLRLLARGVRAGLLRSLRAFSGCMHFCKNHLAWGEHRGGMFVEVSGIDDHGLERIRSWHLVAEGDDGPKIPVLAANHIVRACLHGRVPAAGARPASGSLTLDDYEAMFAKMSVTSGERELPVPREWPLFRRVLGNAWDKLPPQIRNIHSESQVAGVARFSGRASVARGSSILARLVARLVGFPRPGSDIPVSVEMDREDGRESWRRDFSGHKFCSSLCAGSGRMSGLLCESFGPVSVGMALLVDGDTLRLQPRRWSVLGLPMPRFLLPHGDMHESVGDGKFRFHVEIAFPIIGHVVTYQGWLLPQDQESVENQCLLDGR